MTGAILGAFAIAATPVRVVIPIFASRVREWVVVSAALLITAFLFVIYPFMVPALAMGVCSVQPMIVSTLHQVTPPARQGEALGCG